MLPTDSRRGFTLIEMCVAIGIALLLMAVALPSITGQMGRQRLQQAYDRFDALVAEAQRRSVGEGKAYVLVWDDKGAVRLYPANWTAKERAAGPIAALIPTPGGERYALDRNSSLNRSPESSWIFWPSGNCEPVNILFDGPTGTWTAEYNPLSARGTMTRFVVR
jgi:prepilin-type N-terminal cleavage/methylation domain-containing protein